MNFNVSYQGHRSEVYSEPLVGVVRSCLDTVLSENVPNLALRFGNRRLVGVHLGVTFGDLWQHARAQGARKRYSC